LKGIFPYISPEKIRKNAKFWLVSWAPPAPWQSERPSLHCEVFASTVMVTSNLGGGVGEGRAREGEGGKRYTARAAREICVYPAPIFLAAKHVFLMDTSCSVVRGLELESS